MLDERIFCEVTAKRKGRGGTGQAPCTLKIGHMPWASDDRVVLRTIDVSGRPPLVALLTPEQARSIAEALLRAAHAVEGS